MTDKYLEEQNTDTAEHLPANGGGSAQQPERSDGAPLFVMRAKMSDAYTDDSLKQVLNKYSEDDLKRQSERLFSLYDEPETPDYTPIDFGAEESS